MNAHSGSDKVYSYFWAVWSVFMTLIVLQTIYLIEDFKENSQLNATRAGFRQVLASAQTIAVTTENVGKDLLALSEARSSEADKIIAEFNIKLADASKGPSKATNGSK